MMEVALVHDDIVYSDAAQNMAQRGYRRRRDSSSSSSSYDDHILSNFSSHLRSRRDDKRARKDEKRARKRERRYGQRGDEGSKDAPWKLIISYRPPIQG